MEVPDGGQFTDHFLPGLDDGAQNLEESIEMLKMAAAAGTCHGYRGYAARNS